VQANAVATALAGLGAETEIVPITTSGDAGRAAPTDKSRFVKEIEEALLAGEVDLAVHSAKDVPGRLPDGLAIAAVPSGEDPRDALVGASGVDQLPDGARVGTSSLRRRSQLLAINPLLEVLPLRGNVDTRLQKLADGEYDTVALALAGLRRLGRENGAHPLPLNRIVPAPGQGLLAIETRAEDLKTNAVSALEDRAARCRLEAERAIVEELDASCHTPVGAHARVDSERIVVHAYVGLPDGKEWITDRLDAPASDPRSAGRALARRLLSAGAGELLRRAQAVG
jgi:hydroxymethylbilane synthase